MYRLVFMGVWYAIKIDRIDDNEVARLIECVDGGDIIAYCDDIDVFCEETGIGRSEIELVDKDYYKKG